MLQCSVCFVILPIPQVNVSDVAGERWPLLIDPQLQGIKWIKNRYSNNLKVVSLGQRG